MSDAEAAKETDLGKDELKEDENSGLCQNAASTPDTQDKGV